MIGFLAPDFLPRFHSAFAMTASVSGWPAPGPPAQVNLGSTQLDALVRDLPWACTVESGNITVT